MRLSNYNSKDFYDEMITTNGNIRNHYELLNRKIEEIGNDGLRTKKGWADEYLRKAGITFNVYNEEQGVERIFPFDIIPRIIEYSQWEKIEKGLIQRVNALNLFLTDIYSSQKIIKDKVIPRELIESSKGFLKPCIGLKPNKNVWCHVSGIDLIVDENGDYFVLEDNIRCPSGVSYVLANREITKRIFPEMFQDSTILPVFDYPIRLLNMLSHFSEKEKPLIAVLTPGIYNSAYFEHSYLAEQMGVYLVEGRDLVVKDDAVQMKTTTGYKKVDVLYRRIDDTFIDPIAFNPNSMLGIPGIFEVYKKGNIVLANAPGTGVADDKIIYTYVPEMIKYYLNEDPIISNVPTYVCSDSTQKKYVLENLEKLVVKAANESGGYGMLMGPSSTSQEREEFKEKINSNPRNYLAQPVMRLSTCPTLIDKKIEPRHVDLRPFILCGKTINVIPGGLTRVALKKGSLVVNSSQGGGSKDTWIIR